MSADGDDDQLSEAFFEEVEELLATIEQQLLSLDTSNPDVDQFQAIFRAAHSIKGGAAMVGACGILAETSHSLENVVALLSSGKMPLQTWMLDLLLETKDVLEGQVISYRNGQEPDVQASRRICARLQAAAAAAPCHGDATPDASVVAGMPSPMREPAATAARASVFCVRVSRVTDNDVGALLAELSLLGSIVHQEQSAGELDVWLDTSASAADIAAVCGFTVKADQVRVFNENPLGCNNLTSSAFSANTAGLSSAIDAPSKSSPPVSSEQPQTPLGRSIRLGVEKLDQVIDLVDELIMTQAMAVNASSALDPADHPRLFRAIQRFERNALDLKSAMMLMRAMPMDAVFGRLARIARDSAAKLGKKVRLAIQGREVELDRSLIERIIDPLTHIVRNSVDHGIETPEKRRAAGKSSHGNLTLSAAPHGAHLVIEVSDDGAGLQRDRILRKALSLGLPVTNSTPDNELWPLILLPGFSTANQVTEISGRGVGMDVVRHNIHAIGGQIQLFSRAGQGTTTRITLPLTRATRDGRPVQAAPG
ncbi:ATP-binding protein [Allopusillimonas ginsengisoli]|uniref:ATP-binding protein n=1 Tax=Allopusillimonas ginsengisoli TaxID=453575 RepID=UPI001431E7CB|nr:ATP-binding protein [Allopusillimonas ginsengisoli]